MPFLEDILKHNRPIWDRCAGAPFVRGLRDGTLPLEKFKGYMIQDSIYLKHYARVCGKAIYHAETLREIQTYYSLLGFVTEAESAVRLNYLARFGLTDGDLEGFAPLPENQRYIDFLVETAERGEAGEILMAVLPCMLSYSYIFRKAAAAPGSADSRYWDFIQDYGDDQYAESCAAWSAFAQEKCGRLPAEKQERLGMIFQQASLLEYGFWGMAYGERDRGEENR